MTQIQIKSNDRILVVGKTGSGKSYLVRNVLFPAFERPIFFDWKRREYRHMNNVPKARTLSGVEDWLSGKADVPDDSHGLVYVPKEQTDDVFNELCRVCYEAGNNQLIVDETKGIYSRVGNASLLPFHDRLMVEGRDLGVGITHVTQRPKRVPMECVSEAEHIFAFRLNLKDDRDRLKEVMGEAAFRLKDLQKYHYLYMAEDWNEPKACKPVELPNPPFPG